MRRISPDQLNGRDNYLGLSFTEYHKENYEKAMECALKINLPNFHWAQIHLAVAYGQLGRTAEGRATIDKLLYQCSLTSTYAPNL